uniref:Ovule protein n=1 Tax=Rodentolepis nana TaxID=102285 RepID=A0A0R3T8E9_RODNA
SIIINTVDRRGKRSTHFTRPRALSTGISNWRSCFHFITCSPISSSKRRVAHLYTSTKVSRRFVSVGISQGADEGRPKGMLGIHGRSEEGLIWTQTGK